MDKADLVRIWFQKWEEGDYLNLPITANFKHTSPYGIIEGKAHYESIVAENEDSFLGHTFEVHHVLCSNDKACAMYTVTKDDFCLKATEWYLFKGDKIEEIISHYNVGDDKKIEIN